MSMVITDEKKYQRAIRAKAFSEVLEIIQKADDENRDHLGVVLNDDMDKAYSIIWERVVTLKGGTE